MKIGYEELLAEPGFFDAFKASLPKIKGTVLDDMYSCIGAQLNKQGVFNERLQASMFIAMCETFGGTTVYIPSGERIKQILRDIKMHKEFKGDNTAQLSVKYRLSEREVNSILEKQRALQKDARDHLERIGINHA